LLRLTRHRAHQTESNCCDILSSFYKEKVQADDCYLGRGKLTAVSRKQGQLAKAQLGQHCDSSSGCQPSLLLPLLRTKVSSNAAAPAFTSLAVQMSPDGQLLYHFAMSISRDR